MSVIFKTLEKVRNSSMGEEKGGARPKGSRNIYSFRGMVISPLGVLCLAVLLILAALFSTCGSNFMGGHFSGNDRKPGVSLAKRTLDAAIDVKPKYQASRKQETRPGPSENTDENIRDQDVPEPPATIPVEETTSGKLYLPSSDSKKSRPPSARMAKYMPPKNPAALQTSSGEIEATAEQPPLIKEQVLMGNKPGKAALGGSGEKSPKERPQLLTDAVFAQAALPAEDVQASYIPASNKVETKTGYGEGATEQMTLAYVPGEGLPVEPGGVLGGDAEGSLKKGEGMAPRLSGPFDRGSLRALGSIPSESLGPGKVRDARAEGIHQVNLEKAARVGRLVSRIEKSMKDGDMDDAKALIDQLTQFKGEESAYLLKLRAVWHMRQRDYASAASLLTRVLEKEKDDLEAGINMAIVEIKTHRLDKARKRLAGLREIYQGNTFIPELIRETGG